MPRPASWKLAALLIASSTASLAVAQVTVLVDEDFESYADTSALFTVWAPATGAGAPTVSNAGRLVDETYTNFLTLDDLDPQPVGARAFPTGGQGVEHFGGSVLRYQPALNGGSPLVPTETQSIVIEGDIFDVGGTGNKRISIGLRATSPAAANLIELGQWNADPIGYAYRGQSFGVSGGATNPNWQFFSLPVELDRPDDLDEVTTLLDLGEAWHRYRATVTPTTVTFEIDLFRDGIVNDGSDTPGFDNAATWNICDRQSKSAAPGAGKVQRLLVAGSLDWASPHGPVWLASYWIGVCAGRP